METDSDLLIIGAGPFGLAMGRACEAFRAGLSDRRKANGVLEGEHVERHVSALCVRLVSRSAWKGYSGPLVFRVCSRSHNG